MTTEPVTGPLPVLSVQSPSGRRILTPPPILDTHQEHQ